MSFSNVCLKVIAWSFYSVFLLVPLVFYSKNSELFELNKMWVTFGIVTIIAAAWLIRMILDRKIIFTKTLLFIPLIIFLVSQIISTIFSIDQHVSWWGYYSRFNGGLLSIICYILLYFAFVSNLNKAHVLNVLKVSLFSGLIVSLWGLPSHFGYDPTCYIIRGSFDVSCWTQDFKPVIRIFSTLGQPDWLAAYLTILIPIALAFGIKNYELRIKNNRHNALIHYSLFIILSILYYVDLLYTKSRAGFIGISIPLIFFFVAMYFYIKKMKPSLSPITYTLYPVLAFLLITFLIGTPIEQINKFTLNNLLNKSQSTPTQKTQSIKAILTSTPTDSGTIRLIVWQGAINIWKANPIFGTGVETFAFSYYKFRPVVHNLTSEWDFLYNKAHNEYLNYLATTGAVGLGAYLLLIGAFIFFTIKSLFISKNDNLEKNKNLDSNYTLIALLVAYLTILITNFFGFSVVIVNLYLFLIPAFVFVLNDKNVMLERSDSILKKDSIGRSALSRMTTINNSQWFPVILIILTSLFLIYKLFIFWLADIDYAYGQNLDHVEEYKSAYPYLIRAIATRNDEPIFQDELSNNNSMLALDYAKNKDDKNAEKFAKEAIILSNDLTTNFPNNVVFWKTRVHIFVTLGQINPQYYSYALQAIQMAKNLAPTDAKISYNLGVLYYQNGDAKDAINTLRQTITLKKDYYDAYYALASIFHETSLDKNGKVINSDLEKMAVDTLKYVLKNLSPNDKKILDLLKSWREPLTN